MRPASNFPLQIPYKIVVVILLTLNIGITCHAQEMHSDNLNPVYSKGIDSLEYFIKNNLVYPENAKKEGVSGIVTVGFTITKEGNIENVHRIKGIAQECDEEAIRVVSLMKGWQPAVQWGKAVNTEVVLPVSFINEVEVISSESKTISGIVTDKCSGKPLNGILVLVWGSNLGTITDDMGSFKLDVPADKDKLEIISTEYCRQVIHIESFRIFNIALEKEVYTVDFKSDKILDSSGN